MISSWLFSLYEGTGYLQFSGRAGMIGALLLSLYLVITELRLKSDTSEVWLSGIGGFFAGGIGAFLLCAATPLFLGSTLWAMFL